MTLPDWIRSDWPVPAHVVAGSTTRSGGVSRGPYRSLNLGAHVGDDAGSVEENRRRFITGCGLPGEPGWLRQVHGKRVVIAGSDEFAGGPPDADAVVADSAGAVVAVMTADCLPVLLCSRGGDEVAALHCGWRSLAAGIVDETLKRMSTGAADLMAWLGPGISQTAFEVGDDVRDIFLAGYEGAHACFEPNERGRWQADLEGLARLQLVDAGVTSIYGGGMCTFSDPERFFSYRRDGQTGRMATFVAIR